MRSYSVLMCVYRGENPLYFREAVQSMLSQTVSPNDFVIVCDGPLTDELNTVINNFINSNPKIMNIIRLPANVGVGAATNEGLKHCKNELIAKMDSNDISVTDRCEKQLKRFESNPDITILGGFIEEFDTDENKPFDIREVPTENNQIKKYARRRQPFNNVTVMYKRSSIINVGGYRNLNRGEDYDLYIRLLKSGYYAENLDDVLVKVRVKLNGHIKRHSFETVKGFLSTRWNTHKIGYSSLWDFTICCIAEIFVFICPSKLQHFIYRKFLRKSL